MKRKTKNFLEWMHYIKSIHYSKAETIYQSNKLIVLLSILVASCGSTREVYDLEMTTTKGKTIERSYKLPDSVRLSISEKNCLIYTMKDSTVYCLKYNIINFRRN